MVQIMHGLNCLDQTTIQITQLQKKYLRTLKDGPKQTRDIYNEVGNTTMQAAGKMVHKLKNAGLITAEKKKGAQGNIFIYHLVMPYDDMCLEISRNTRRNKVTEEEILYAAILRNAGMTGQQLTEQYRKVYPKRSEHGISNIVDKARRARWCR